MSEYQHYEWSDLKADPIYWMRRYFDAFIHSTNWCSCHLSLRLPKAVFRRAELEPFVHPFVLSIEATDTHWILGWSLAESEDYDRFAEDDGSGWMQIPVTSQYKNLKISRPTGHRW